MSLAALRRPPCGIFCTRLSKRNTGSKEGRSAIEVLWMGALAGRGGGRGERARLGGGRRSTLGDSEAKVAALPLFVWFVILTCCCFSRKVVSLLRDRAADLMCFGLFAVEVRFVLFVPPRE